MSVNMSFATHSIEIASWQRSDEMVRELAHCNTGTLALGVDAEHAMDYHSVIVSIDIGSPGIRRFGVGICSEAHGLVPQLLLRPASELLVLGFNSQVVGIAPREGRIRFMVECEDL